MPPNPELDDLNYPLHVKTPGYIVTQATRRAIERQRYLPVLPRLIGVNQVEVTQRLSYPSHRHCDYEVVFIESGPYRCQINRRRVTLESGQALVICPDDTHEVDLRPGQSHRILHFFLADPSSGSTSPLKLIDPSAPPVKRRFDAPLDSFFPLLDQIKQEQGSERPFSTQIQDSLLQTLFWLLLCSLDPEALSAHFRQQSADQAFLNRFYAFVESRLHRKVSVNEAAKALRIGRSSLAKRCRRLLGEPPSRVFMRSKVRHASILLDHPDASVKEVAYQLGFQNQYHFSRVFKSVMGYPPSEARGRSRSQS